MYPCWTWAVARDITEAVLGKGLAVHRYVGIDVDGELIDFLQSHVQDPRLQFFRLNTHNRLYNPTGQLLTPDFRLPVDEQFDAICLFSVFTHLDPRLGLHARGSCNAILRSPGNSSSRAFSMTACPVSTTRVPENPLERAVYTEALFRHLLAGTGGGPRPFIRRSSRLAATG